MVLGVRFVKRQITLELNEQKLLIDESAKDRGELGSIGKDATYPYVHEDDVLFEQGAVKFKPGNSSRFIQPDSLKIIVTSIKRPFIIVNIPFRGGLGSILIAGDSKW